MNNIYAVFIKQFKETFKNKAVLIQFLMFPVLVVIMENIVKLDYIPNGFFARLFAVMFIGMAPLVCMSSIVSEEKERNTIRTLIMSGVKSWQYLLATGLYILIMCMVGILVFAFIGKYEGSDILKFILLMYIGIFISIIIGAVIGIISNNQMSAMSVSVPVMMILSFLPMLSMFNDNVKKIAALTYPQQISLLINNEHENLFGSIAVLAVNFITAFIIFIFAYRRQKMD